MTDPTLRTTQLHRWVDRIQAGDLHARDELLREVCGRLERLAQRMLGSFPRLRRWVESGDVLQGALVRLMRALGEVRPPSSRSFLALAAQQMRRELLDLTKHFYGPRGQGLHHASVGPGADTRPDPPEPADCDVPPEEMERWGRFHEEVERLPAEEREIVGLIFYHSWTRLEVAALLQLDEKTVRRRWRSILLKLHQALGDALPDDGPAE